MLPLDTRDRVPFVKQPNCGRRIDVFGCFLGISQLATLWETCSILKPKAGCFWKFFLFSVSQLAGFSGFHDVSC